MGELGCNLWSGFEKASIDIDKLIGISHLLMEGSQVPRARDRNVSLFSKQKLFSNPQGNRDLSKCLTLGKGLSWGDQTLHFRILQLLVWLIQIAKA